MSPDGDELADHDYESIYGREALEARWQARVEASWRSHDAAMARMDEHLRNQNAILARLNALSAGQKAPPGENPLRVLQRKIETLEKENDELRRRDIRRFWGEEEEETP